MKFFKINRLGLITRLLTYVADRINYYKNNITRVLLFHITLHSE